MAALFLSTPHYISSPRASCILECIPRSPQFCKINPSRSFCSTRACLSGRKLWGVSGPFRAVARQTRFLVVCEKVDEISTLLNTKTNSTSDDEVPRGEFLTVPSPSPKGSPLVMERIMGLCGEDAEVSEKLIGAILLVSSSTIGASMLALPTVTHRAGFPPSALTLIAGWVYMCASGLLLLEVSAEVGSRPEMTGREVNFISMVHTTLGVFGEALAWLGIGLSGPCFFCAYIVQVGAIISEVLQSVTGVETPLFVGCIAFTAVFGSLIVAGTETVDRWNRVLSVGLALSFLTLLIVSAPHMSPANLLYASWFKAVPVVSTVWLPPSGIVLCSSLPLPKRTKIKHGPVSEEHPDLASQWHPTLNGDLLPSDVTSGSGRIVWWQCNREASHAWRAKVSNRCHNRSGCPYCVNYPGFITEDQSLSYLYPSIAMEFDPIRNGHLRPTELAPTCNTRVWWRCRKDPSHQWEMSINARVMRNISCPYCRTRKFPRGSLMTEVRPDLVEEFDNDRNDVPVSSLMYGSDKIIWWKCKKDPSHKWQASVRFRVRGACCPFCARRYASAMYNLSQRPEVARFWHPSRNGTLTPESVLPYSSKKFWWLCPVCDHEWSGLITRGRNGQSCPECMPKKAKD